MKFTTNNEDNKMFKIGFLTKLLNKYADAYYNNEPIATDEEYDNLYKQLEKLEKETGYKYSNSPINRVGYVVQNNIKKSDHSDMPMLSLKKIHSIQEIKDFKKDKECIMSLKADGLTIRLTYKNGILVKGETRGDGLIGSDITHNVQVFQEVPHIIPLSGTVIIDGEAIVTNKDFEEVNKNVEIPFKLQRSLASGSVALLDPAVTKSRKITFLAWNFIQGSFANTYIERFKELENMGFFVVPHIDLQEETIEEDIELLKNRAKQDGIPIDGIVISYDDISYGKSLGKTDHHFNNGVAYKFEDEIQETTILGFDWTMGRTGVLTPVAVFHPVEIDGTEVTRASCHNLTYLKNMCLGIGDHIGVYKANMIIPQIKLNYTNSSNFNIPLTCPICGHITEIKKEEETEVLYCTNDNCQGKIIGKFTHFVSKKAMNIDGISESTIETLVDLSLLKEYSDFYHLSEHQEILKELKGYGPKKIQNMLDSIEKSRKCKLDNLITSLGIPLIGKTASKILSTVCNGDYWDFCAHMDSSYDWTMHDGFGEEMMKSLYSWWLFNRKIFDNLGKELEIQKPDTNSKPKFDLQEQTFCITGSLIKFENRDELVKLIEHNNGKVVSGVSKKTNYLICNEKSNSSKYKKAEDLGIPIITEEDFITMVGE